MLTARLLAAAPAIESLHRLYDLSLVSKTNPVLANVEACSIEIPVSEFRAFLDSDLVYTEGKRGPLTLAEKRDCLERLLDDHFLLWAAYQKKADQTPGVAGLLNTTRNMLLEEALIQREIGMTAGSPEDYQKSSDALRQRIFDKTDIRVSNEAYATLKAAVGRLNQAETKTATNHSAGTATPDGLTARERETRLATCKVGTVTIGDVLQAYEQQPADRRPDLARPDGLIALLKQMLGDALMVAEARDRGLEHSILVREKLQLNRNVLSRMWYLDQLTAQAVATLKQPGTEDKLREWYQAHLKSLYTDRDAAGAEHVVSFEGEHDRIQDDYFEDLQTRLRAETIQSLRRGRKIRIDESRLAELRVQWPLPPPAEAESRDNL